MLRKCPISNFISFHHCMDLKALAAYFSISAGTCISSDSSRWPDSPQRLTWYYSFKRSMNKLNERKLERYLNFTVTLYELKISRVHGLFGKFRINFFFSRRTGKTDRLRRTGAESDIQVSFSSVTLHDLAVCSSFGKDFVVLSPPCGPYFLPSLRWPTKYWAVNTTKRITPI